MTKGSALESSAPAHANVDDGLLRLVKLLARQVAREVLRAEAEDKGDRSLENQTND
jgi:hypothetical protein